MENFRKIANIILSIDIDANEHDGKMYYFVANPIIDAAFNNENDLIQLRRDAITDLLDRDIEISQRQLSRLKRIVQDIYGIFFNEEYNHSNEDLFDQISIIASFRGLIINRKYDRSLKLPYIISDNFIIELENELDARLHTIGRMEEDVLQLELEPFSIYGTDEDVIEFKVYDSAPKEKVNESELPWLEWNKITKREASPQLNKAVKVIKTYDELFHEKYKYQADDFTNILRKDAETDSGRCQLSRLVNDNNEWIGTSGKIAYIFYRCLLTNGIVLKVKGPVLTKTFLNKFFNLSGNFATNGNKASTELEEAYEKYFYKSIKDIKIAIDKH